MRLHDNRNVTKIMDVMKNQWPEADVLYWNHREEGYYLCQKPDAGNEYPSAFIQAIELVKHTASYDRVLHRQSHDLYFSCYSTVFQELSSVRLRTFAADRIYSDEQVPNVFDVIVSMSTSEGSLEQRIIVARIPNNSHINGTIIAKQICQVFHVVPDFAGSKRRCKLFMGQPIIAEQKLQSGLITVGIDEIQSIHFIDRPDENLVEQAFPSPLILELESKVTDDKLMIYAALRQDVISKLQKFYKLIDKAERKFSDVNRLRDFKKQA